MEMETEQYAWSTNSLAGCRDREREHFGRQLFILFEWTVFVSKWNGRISRFACYLHFQRCYLKVNVKLDRKQTSNNILPDWNAIAKWEFKVFYSLSAILLLLFVIFALLVCWLYLSLPFTLPLSLLPFLHFIPHTNGVEWIELDWIGVKWMRIWIKAVCCVLKWLVGLCVYLGGRTITILVNPLFRERELKKPKREWQQRQQTRQPQCKNWWLHCIQMGTKQGTGYKKCLWEHTHTHALWQCEAVLFPTLQNYILVYIFLFKLSILTKWMTFVAQSHTNLLNSPHLQP